MGGPVDLKGDGSLRTRFLFPADGEYILFVEFYPNNGSREVATASLKVGSSAPPAAPLAADASLTQKVGNLQITLKSNQALVANQPLYMNFEALDAAGNSRSDAIQAQTGIGGRLIIVDEKLTTLLRPDYIDRHKLQFAVTFPKPGKYKVWFGFKYAVEYQIAYTIEVK
jgi:hypothetical protein